jgi:hypothetical protein
MLPKTKSSGSSTRMPGCPGRRHTTPRTDEGLACPTAILPTSSRPAWHYVGAGSIIPARATGHVSTPVIVAIVAGIPFARASDKSTGNSTNCCADQRTFGTTSRSRYCGADRRAANASNHRALLRLRAPSKGEKHCGCHDGGSHRHLLVWSSRDQNARKAYSIHTPATLDGVRRAPMEAPAGDPRDLDSDGPIGLIA